MFNQNFYWSKEWEQTRDKVILRDSGCDLGIFGRDIHDQIYVHHMNPITMDDLQNNLDLVLNPEYLICASKRTHRAIHYGSEDSLLEDFVERKPNDTLLW